MSCEGCGGRWQAGSAVESGIDGKVIEGVGGLSRRRFMERLALAAAGVVLVGCDAGVVAPQLPQGGPYTVSPADYPALGQVGGVARVTLSDGSVIGVGRVSGTEFAAYGLGCTHEGTPVRVSGNGWICPSHDAVFNAAGDVVQGPARSPLVALATSYDAASDTLTIS